MLRRSDTLSKWQTSTASNRLTTETKIKSKCIRFNILHVNWRNKKLLCIIRVKVKKNGSILSPPPSQCFLCPPVSNYMLLYSTLLGTKIARAPGGHKRFMLTKLGGGVKQNRSNKTWRNRVLSLFELRIFIKASEWRHFSSNITTFTLEVDQKDHFCQRLFLLHFNYGFVKNWFKGLFKCKCHVSYTSCQVCIYN